MSKLVKAQTGGEAGVSRVLLCVQVAALFSLIGCATVDQRLPWTADNVQAVAKKCGMQGLTVESTGYFGGGLSAIGEEPQIFKSYRCLKRRIQVPPNFIVVSG